MKKTRTFVVQRICPQEDTDDDCHKPLDEKNPPRHAGRFGFYCKFLPLHCSFQCCEEYKRKTNVAALSDNRMKQNSV